MSWLAERPRRAVAVALVAFVVVMAAVGVGGALAGGNKSAAPAPSRAVAVQLRRELAAEQRGTVMAGRRLSTQMARVGFWRKRARRAEKALQRAGRKR